MYTEEKRYSVLARQLKNYDYVIIDTCSLMDESFPDWMNVFERAKKEYVDETTEDFHAYVPYRCYEELKKHAKAKGTTPELIEKQIAAKRALRIVKWAKFRRVLEITKKDKEENYADNAITVKVIHDRLDKRILVITQDKGLASDLLYWNHSQSQRGKYVAVYCIDSNGDLAPNRGKTNSVRDAQKTNKPYVPERNAQPKQQPQKPINAPKKPDYDAITNDKRLKALLTNPNYPSDKKKKDVQSHLEGLSSLPEEKKKSLPLLLTEGMLRQFLLTGTLSEKKPAQPILVKPEPQKAVQEPVVEDKPKEMTTEILLKKFRYGEGFSLKEAISQCGTFYNVMFRYHSIPYNAQFHGPIDLTEEDLDAMARLADTSLEGNNLIHVEYKCITLYVLPRNVTFRVWMDLSDALPKPTPKEESKQKPDLKKPKTAAKPAQKVDEKPNKAPVKPEPILETQKQEQAEKSAKNHAKKPQAKKSEALNQDKPIEPKPEDKPTLKERPRKAKKVIKVETPADNNPAKQDDIKPEVMEPALKKPAKKKAEPKTSAQSKAPSKPTSKKTEDVVAKTPNLESNPQPEKAEAKAKGQKPSPKKSKPEPKKQADAKKESAKSEPEKPAKPNVEAAKTNPSSKKKTNTQTPAKPKQAKKEDAAKQSDESKKKKANAVKEKTPASNDKKQEKAEKPQQKPTKNLSLFEEAKAADMRLKANINNPNYPVKSKVNDLKKQLDYLKKLKVEERGSLTYSIDMIKTMINMLEPKK